MAEAWSWLNPEDEEILASVESLPIVENPDSLPYQNPTGKIILVFYMIVKGDRVDIPCRRAMPLCRKSAGAS